MEWSAFLYGWRSPTLASLVAVAVLAGRSDVSAGMSGSEVVRDLGVGIVLVLAGMAMTAQPLTVGLMAVAGLSWLVASTAGPLASVHAGALVLALLSLPTGRIEVRSLGGAVALLALLVATGVVPQPGVAAVYLVTALLVKRGRSGVVGLIGGGAATVLAGMHAGLWTWSRAGTETFDSAVALEIYQAALVVVATGLVVLTRVASAGAVRGPFVALEEVDRAGLRSFEWALGATLGRVELRVHRWVEDTGSYVDADDTAVERMPGDHWFLVRDGERRVAAVVGAGSALAAVPLREAVAEAVRIACRNEVLRGQLETSLEELKGSRARLLTAADEARARTSRELAADVEIPLARVLAELRRRDPTRLSGADALGIAEQELSRTLAELARIVDGAPPAELGDGRVVGAVRDLVAACGLPGAVRVNGVVAGEADAETAVYYVCSEGIANAIKHAHASRVDIELATGGESVRVLVRDDGVGGADATGPGLQGLADRVATRGGRLRVMSEPGAGTVIEARLPTRSWSTA